MSIVLTDLPPAAFEAWTVVFDLAEDFAAGWVVVGGQMVQLHAAELGAREGIRPTDDVDVIVDTRSDPAGTERLAGWLVDHKFDHAGTGPTGIGHRYTRAADPGPGVVMFDVLAPEGVGERASRTTTPPARTVEVPGGAQALHRAETIEVSAVDMTGRRREGRTRRPNLLGALVGKAAATTIAVRPNPERDWQDAALLLSNVPDPFELAHDANPKDRKRLARLQRLDDRRHVGWALLGDEDYRRGMTALAILIESPLE